jgi:hypothetical protein
VPREVVALVSADDVIAAVRVHADRLHDLLRRSGCGPEESVEVCEAFAIALVDALVSAPESVVDMAGWWFGKALELVRRLGDTAAEPAGELPDSVLAGTSGEAQVRSALAGIPEGERAAVMLRDAYDLPPQAVAVALRRDADGADGLVALGRMHLVSRYDDQRVPDLAAHEGRTAVDLVTLSRLADGTLPPPRTVALRRHLGSCTACEEVVEVLSKGRRLAAGLPVIALPDEARETLLERVSERAHAQLPTPDEVLSVVEADESESPLIAPVIAVVAVVLALILGVAVAAVLRSGPTGAQVPAGAAPSLPSVTPSFSVAPTKSPSRTPTPRRTTPSLSPSSQASSTRPSTAPSSATPPPEAASISISPTSGPRGTTIDVFGTGWAAHVTVTVTYSGAISSSRTTVVTDRHGRFSAQITAAGLVPGSYTVRASGGGQSASAQFDQTT